MKKWALVFFCIIGASSGALAQQIQLKVIYQKAIRPDYTRYEYVFSVHNDTPHRLRLFANVCLLDASDKVLDERFMNFETLPGTSSTDSIESDCGPAGSETAKTPALSYRLLIRDDAMNTTSQKEGNLDAPIVNEQG
jgi:hypothetical protein